MTIKKLIDWATHALLEFDSPRLDAELLLSHVLKKDQAYLLAHDDHVVSYWRIELFKRLIKKRKKAMPVAYLIGHKAFYGLDFYVNRHVLIPRPDTEILVDSVLAYIQPGDTLLDVGTGSGCIPISILMNQSRVNAVATDISKKALVVAKKNVKKYKLGRRIQLYKSHLLQDVPLDVFDEDYLVVTANLPYVPPDYQVNAEARFEPALALYAEEDGVSLYQTLLDQLGSLRPRAIFLECYEFQLAILANHLEGYSLKLTKNLLGEARMLMLERD